MLELVLSVDGVAESFVHTLAGVGAVEFVSTDPFGDGVLARPGILVQAGWSTWRAHMDASVVQARFQNALESPSNLMLALEACHRGWTLVDRMLPPQRPGQELEFEIRMLSRSLLYLRALMDESSIYSKGAAEIHHGMPSAYYKCLLSLPSLEALVARSDLLTMKNAEFEAIAMGRIVASEGGGMAALADGEVEGPCNDLLPLPAGHRPEEDDTLADMLRDVVEPPSTMSRLSWSLHGKTVRFDNFSHESGNQRGYITCSRNRT